MNLLEIRTQFVKMSGRNDLVSGSNDNGANFYINSGQKFLDRRYRFPKDVGIYPATIEIGGWYALITYSRQIKEVWVADSAGRRQLTKLSIQDFFTKFSNPLLDNVPGTTLYYTPSILRQVPESDSVTVDNWNAVLGYMPTLVGSHYEYNGIIIGPRTDTKLHLEIWGLFYTPELSDNDDQSFWSVVHPEVLLYAALYELEISYRNTQGANDWLNAISIHGNDIDMDSVGEDSSDIDQMEG